MKRIQGVLEIGPLVFLYVDIRSVIHSYTDKHDVDEDLRTILIQGGRWNHEGDTGITFRAIADTPTLASSNVASYV